MHSLLIDADQHLRAIAVNNLLDERSKRKHKTNYRNDDERQESDARRSSDLRSSLARCSDVDLRHLVDQDFEARRKLRV